MKMRIMAAFVLFILLLGAGCSLAQQEYTYSGEWGYLPAENNGIVLTAYKGTKAHVQVPAEVDGRSVTALGEGLFARNQYIESVSVPEGVQRLLGEKAFYFCANLKRVELPASLTDLGDGNPFSDCMALEEIVLAEDHPAFRMENGVLFEADGSRLICYPPALSDESYTVPAGTQLIEARAFSCAAYLKQVQLPAGLQEIGSGAFYSCIQLEAMDIPEGVTSIDGAFASCLKLREVKLPASIAAFGENPFADCSRLETVQIDDAHPSLAFANGVIYDKNEMRVLLALAAGTAGDCSLPEGIRSIAPKAFMGCVDTKKVTLPESMEAIGSYAFYDTNITGVNLPAGVQLVENGAFASCNSLKNIEVAENNPIFYDNDGVLFSRRDARLVCYPAGRRSDTYKVPAGTMIIGVGAFQANGYIESVLLPEGLIAIEGAAFNNCTALSGMLMPQSLDEIGDSAFASAGLTSILMPGGIARMGAKVFAGCPQELRLVVPRDSAAQQYAQHAKLSYIHPEELPALERGARGGDVVLLQQKLILAGFLADDADGVYGPITTEAVSAFQQSLGIEEPSGAADAQTMAALFS